MANELSQIEATPAQLAVVKATVFPGCTDEELQLFAFDCKRAGVHPLSRMIHPQVRTNRKDGSRRYVPITSIDLFRARASDTGELAGISDPVFSGKPGTADFQATVTVKRIVKNLVCEFTATARWLEYLPEPPGDYQWRKMPHVMLGKCAESLALRKGFPQQLHGFYTKEEMDQAGGGQQSPEPPMPRRKSDPKPAKKEEDVEKINQILDASASVAPVAHEEIPIVIPEQPKTEPEKPQISVNGKVLGVQKKTGPIKDGKPTWTRYTVKLQVMNDEKPSYYGTFDTKIGEYADTMKDKPVELFFHEKPYKKDGKDQIGFEIDSILPLAEDALEPRF